MRYGIIKIFHNLPVEHFAMKGRQSLIGSIIRIGRFVKNNFLPLSKQLRSIAIAYQGLTLSSLIFFQNSIFVGRKLPIIEKLRILLQSFVFVISINFLTTICKSLVLNKTQAYKDQAAVCLYYEPMFYSKGRAYEFGFDLSWFSGKVPGRNVWLVYTCSFLKFNQGCHG